MADTIDSFKDLLDDVRNCPERGVTTKIEMWREAFKKTWTNESGQWISLIDLLPVNSETDPTVENFGNLIHPAPKIIPLSIQVFLSKIAYEQFHQRYWTDQLGNQAVRLCAGLVNLHGLVCRSKRRLVTSSRDALQHAVGETLRSYPVTLFAVALYNPKLVQFMDHKCNIFTEIEIDSPALRNRLFDVFGNYGKHARESLSELLKKNPESLSETLNMLGTAFDFEQASISQLMRYSIVEKLVLPFSAMLNHFLNPVSPDQLQNGSEFEWLVVTTLQDGNAFSSEDDYFISILEHWPFPSRTISKKMKGFDLDTLLDDKRKSFFDIWGRYLYLDDEFAYCWSFLHVMKRYSKDLLFEGESIDVRLQLLENHLIHDVFFEKGFRHHFNHNEKETFHVTVERRQGWIEFFRAVLSLREMSRHSYRFGIDLEEASARQLTAIKALEKFPDAVSTAIRGILDLVEEYWDRLDPIILGFPKEIVIKTLEEYSSAHRAGPHTKRFHAETLLRHARGEMITLSAAGAGSGSSVLSAVENLIEVSRTGSSRDRSQTWLGDVGIESLWRGAVEAACREFARTFEKWGGQYEHEPVYHLASAIARNLEDTNKTIRNWLADRRTPPLTISLAVRRFQMKSKNGVSGEGGSSGTRADLGIVFRCEVPGLAKADRVTLIQAKSLWKQKWSEGWEGMVPIDPIQLVELLKASDHAHYMFMLNIESNPTPLIVPGKFVLDVLAAQSTKSIPVPVIIRAAKELPSFLVHDIIGLWTGDKDQGLIDKTLDGKNQGVGPWVAIEIRVTMADQDHG